MLLDSMFTRVSIVSSLAHNLHSSLKRGVVREVPQRVLSMPTECADVNVKPRRTARKSVKGTTLSRPKDGRLAKPSAETLLDDWHLFCKTEAPMLVMTQMRAIKELEMELGEELAFGGPRGRLKGRPGEVEDHRHRAFYRTISDSEEKMQNFAARQVACRVLGSKDYACENCWLPIIDCMCGTFKKGDLWPGVQLWLYMHPKDFLRKNNTGKVLWQVFGDSAVRLVICGIQEQEDAMWQIFKQAGRDLIWCVFPEKTPPESTVGDILLTDCNEVAGACPMHFVLIDGTWSNSKSMLSRLKERGTELWGESSMPCISLSPNSVSVMHDLRPQPSMERTCTAAAAGKLLQELSLRSELAERGLSEAAELVYVALDSLQNSLVNRRSRDGYPTSRVGRAYPPSDPDSC